MNASSGGSTGAPAGSVGVIASVSGAASGVCLNPELEVHEYSLKEGDVIYSMEMIVTGADGNVVIHLNNGETQTIGPNASVDFQSAPAGTQEETEYAQADSAATTDAEDEEVAAMQAALAGGADPSTMEATAAGPGDSESNNEGSQVVFLTSEEDSDLDDDDFVTSGSGDGITGVETSSSLTLTPELIFQSAELPLEPVLAEESGSSPAPSSGSTQVISSGPATISFDGSDLLEWESLGLASLQTSFNVDSQSPATFATEGDSFLVLESGGNADYSIIAEFLGTDVQSIDQIARSSSTTGSALKMEVFLEQPKDLVFDYYFDAGDYAPYYDYSFMSIDGEVIKLADVLDTGNFGDTGWVEMSVPLDTGSHEIGFAAIDLLDVVVSSALYIDNIDYV